MRQVLFLLTFVTLLFSQPYNEKMISKIQDMNNTTQKFSFAVYGDNRGRNDVLSAIINNIDKDDNIVFSISNGDLVSDSFEYQFRDYLSIIKTSKKPIVSIIGNHGIGFFENDQNYKIIFGPTYFSFAFGNSYFIALDDADDEGISLKQLSWLEKELQKSQKYTHRFVFMHIPLYDPRKGKYKEGHSLDDLQQAKKLNDLFDRYKVTMLFCSHIHSYYRGMWQKTPYIISGGAGAPLKNGGFFHYIKVTVDDTNISYKVIKIAP